MPRLKKLHISLVLLLVPASSFSMVYDNRFIPLFARPHLGLEGTNSFFAVDLMAATASNAFGEKQDDKTLGLPELFGKFDLVRLDEALGLAGCTNDNIRLREEWRGGELPWRVDGKIQMQGIAFYYHQYIAKCFSVGASWLFMRVNACHEFQRGSTNLILSTGDIEEIEKRRRRIVDALGLREGHWKEAGFGDVDLYLRYARRWDYTCKFRRIDAGLRVGLLAPSGFSRDESRPPSIPFGGDGFWGGYVAADALFELKEDMKVGVLVRVSKRASRTTCRRLPINEEPQIFGAALARVNLDPGVTVIFSPYILLENLRKGFGFGVQYTLVSHQQDSWKCVEILGDLLKENVDATTIESNVCRVQEISKWGADYFTINAFYDCGKMCVWRGFDPVISFRWDVPAKMLVVNRIAKTHRVSFGVEFAF